jgi:hypothetical protein
MTPDVLSECTAYAAPVTCSLRLRLDRPYTLRHHGCMSVDGPSTPTEDRLPAWRRACLAYDAWLQAGASDQEAREAAVAAVQTVLRLAWNEARVEAADAIAYAKAYHPEWFWRGCPAR